ncbi:FAST kinase domain-containing protein 4-like [Daphnia carinata]|uniref:FAST kinase domain-containing protein 4-like n=1 Tax=Daphnia carinata TaxID=120202 RepID=UPI00257C7D6E|nr:FAST kinase domain-containing protein 4-like [Daphnia carinata]
MFRTGLLVKFGIVRISSSCPVVQTSVKWCSTSANLSLKQTDSKADEPLSREPAWVKTPLDKQIFSASDARSLLMSVEHQSFDGRCAINVVNILSRWVSEGKFTVSDFQKLDNKAKLEENLLKGEFSVGVFGTLQALKGLLVLGFKPNSKVVESLENEILWLLRKITVGQHLLVMDYYSQMQESARRQQVIKEVVSNVQRRWVEIVEARDFVSLFKHAAHFSPKFIEKMEDVLVELVQGFSQEDQTKILVILGATQRRSTPLLRALSYHLNKRSEKLSVRLAADILFALHRLSFHDHLLMERICNDLVTQLTPEVKSSTIGSLLTSLGQLKYRHEGCLDAICDWVNHNWTKVRYQDVLSLTLCLAALDFLPSCWEPLWEKMSFLLRQKKVSSDLSKFIQLDLAWSLAVLNHLDLETGQSVLNDEFISELLGSTPGNNRGVQMKLNQLWAVATLKKWDLSRLKTALPFTFNNPATGNQKPTLNQAVVSALSNFIPSGKYLRERGQTSLGIEIDAECIMNDKGIPFPLADYDDGKALPANSARVAVIVLNYKDLCKGKPFSTGAQGLRERLLTQSGYRVVTVKHTEFDPRDKLLKKVQNLEQLVKNAVSTTRM